MGVTTAILDATQQQCLAVWQARDGRVKDRIDGICPVFGTKDEVAWMTMEEDFVEAGEGLVAAKNSCVPYSNAEDTGRHNRCPRSSVEEWQRLQKDDP